jgi:DNA-binding response OmpR family regulator
VTTILVAADAQWVRDQVRSAFVAPGQRVIEVTRGQEVRDTFAREAPDLVILDLQIGNMGGVAAAIDLRLEESAGRLPRATILLLLDRQADVFLAKRADADGELVKPADAGTLRRAAKRLLTPPTPATSEPEATVDGATGAVVDEAGGLPEAHVAELDEGPDAEATGTG